MDIYSAVLILKYKGSSNLVGQTTPHISTIAVVDDYSIEPSLTVNILTMA